LSSVAIMVYGLFCVSAESQHSYVSGLGQVCNRIWQSQNNSLVRKMLLLAAFMASQSLKIPVRLHNCDLGSPRRRAGAPAPAVLGQRAAAFGHADGHALRPLRGNDPVGGAEWQ
jgi:hypothetical protein